MSWGNLQSNARNPWDGVVKEIEDNLRKIDKDRSFHGGEKEEIINGLVTSSPSFKDKEISEKPY